MYHHFANLDQNKLVDYDGLIKTVNHINLKLFIELYNNSCQDAQNKLCNNIMNHLIKINESLNTYFLYFIFANSAYNNIIKLPYHVKNNIDTTNMYMYNYI